MLEKKTQIIWLAIIWCYGFGVGSLYEPDFFRALGFGSSTVVIGWLLALPSAFSHKFKKEKKASYYSSWTAGVLIASIIQFLATN